MMIILLDILATEFPNFKSINQAKDIEKIDNGFLVPEEIRMRSLAYLTNKHYVFSWFNKNYERVNAQS